MIGYLRGSVIDKQESYLIIDTNGVGYVVLVPKTLIATKEIGEVVEVFIHTHVREDALQLFGFIDKNSLMLFEQLLSVSGIGPKTALAIIDFGVEAVSHAIATDDVHFFTGIPRLGKKNAQKILIELKSKITAPLSSNHGHDRQQLIEALEQLGFTQKEIRSIYSQIPAGSITLEEKIKGALKLLSRS